MAGSEALLTAMAADGPSKSDGCLQLWEPHSNCQLRAFRGAGAKSHSLVPTRDLLFALHPAKGAISVWTWAQEPLHFKIPMADKVTCLTATSDGAFVFAGTEAGSILAWQTCNGRLWSTTPAHFREVSVLRCLDDNSHIVSGGSDAVVRVWRLSSLISEGSARGTAKHTWTSHSLPVSDIAARGLGHCARIYTSSHDCTCKVWDLASGLLLCTINFPCEIRALAVDIPETWLFCGGVDGSIYRAGLQGADQFLRSHDVHCQPSNALSGHEKPIVSLSVSADSHTLASAESGQVRVWDLHSGQTTKIINHAGEVTNVAFVPRAHFSHTPTVIPPLAIFDRTPTEKELVPILLRPHSAHATFGHNRAVSNTNSGNSTQACVTALLGHLNSDRGTLQSRLAEATHALADSEEQRVRWERCAKTLYAHAAQDVMDDIAATDSMES